MSGNPCPAARLIRRPNASHVAQLAGAFQNLTAALANQCVAGLAARAYLYRLRDQTRSSSATAAHQVVEHEYDHSSNDGDEHAV